MCLWEQPDGPKRCDSSRSAEPPQSRTPKQPQCCVLAFLFRCFFLILFYFLRSSVSSNRAVWEIWSTIQTFDVHLKYLFRMEIHISSRQIKNKQTFLSRNRARQRGPLTAAIIVGLGKNLKRLHAKIHQGSWWEASRERHHVNSDAGNCALWGERWFCWDKSQVVEQPHVF